MVRDDRPGHTVDRDDFVPLIKGDAVLDIPTVVVDDYLLVILLPRKYRREHDAVVIDARFGIEDGGLVAARLPVEEVLQHSAGRHAVADDDKLLGHVLDAWDSLCDVVIGVVWGRPGALALRLSDGKMHPGERCRNEDEEQHEAARPKSG